MRVTRENVVALRAAAETWADAWEALEEATETWLEAEDAEERSDARATIDESLPDLQAAFALLAEVLKPSARKRDRGLEQDG